ncbi:prolyl endopeptidase FAP isoform X1 [Prionailurus iriomotensis]
MKIWLKIVFGIATSAFHDSEGSTTRTLTLKDILNGTFSYKTFFPNWISGQEYLHHNNTMKSLWRYSYTATYHIYDLNTGQFVRRNELPRPIQYLCWSPVGSKLAYVYQNNIYLKQRPEDPPFQITFNGRENKIFNGIPDWVYEEEMLATKYALWWSPNGKFLAYAEFNDTEIPVIAYSYYGDEQYPRTINIPYPKAGAKNPVVRLFIIDATHPEHIGPIEVPVPAMIASSDYYFSWLTWVTDERICFQWLKRIQNVSVLSICDFREGWQTWDCPKTQEHIEESRTGWAGGPSKDFFKCIQTDTTCLIEKTPRFFVSTPVFSYDAISYYKIFSDKDGYKHIHYIKDTVENAIQITSGKWEAINIFRVTQDSLFYSSNEFEGYPGRRNIYRIYDKNSDPFLDGKMKNYALPTTLISIGSYPPSKKCITCHLRKERCQYYTASFSDYAKYYALVCYDGPGLPISTLHDGRTDQEIKILEENKELENALKNIQLPKEEIKKLEVDEITLWYGGPCSQSVRSVFAISWISYLASKEGIVIALVDGRGTAFQGDKLLYAVYRKLGVYEVEDQITAVRKFIEMGFIDEKRIAIWGWSYGGYVSSLALASGTGLFKCGIAVAPVSSWEYYASIYTERFMGLPTKDDNLEHYKNSTVMARAEYFRNVDYLLIHGTADDNVHFQNSAQIAKALVNAQVDFQAMLVL